MFNSELGNQIKERRKVLGITQKHLAELADINSNTLIRIENGKINPTVNIVTSILEVLGLELIVQIKNNK